MALPSVKDAIRGLATSPNDREREKSLQKGLHENPDPVFAVITEEVHQTALEAITTQNDGASSPDPDWVNCVGEQRCTPLEKVKPQSLSDLVAIVKSARAKGQRVRAVGSGHAFSDVARTDSAVLVSPVLLDRVAAVDPATLRSPDAEERSRTLVDVQAGITVRNLTAELDNRGLALINMGGFDGQTISGTLSTGTHGSGMAFGPLASFVRSVVLVSELGTVYQIEPAAGITDPARFAGAVDGVAAVLKQDDDWFRTVAVAVGCVGLIYSYKLDVTPAFSIRELRTSTTWVEMRKALLPDLWRPMAPIVAATDHFEVVLNPYECWFRNACVKVERTRVGDAAASGQRQDWLSRLLEQLSIDSAADLVDFLNKAPPLSPLIIDQALMTLVEPAPYTDKSFNVFSLGPANDIKAMALELHCDAAQCVPTIDRLLDVFGDEAGKHNWYLAGPLGIRFVRAADAFLAPEAGRMTCTIELDMLVGVSTGRELVTHIKERMCTADAASPRVHWGLDLDLVTKDDVRAWYPDFERWNNVYKTLNSSGMFDNKFTDRLGVGSAPKP